MLSCRKKSEPSSTDPTTLTDIDGNVYKTIRIGNQLWMSENLKVTRYRNGDEIPNIIDPVEWGYFTEGAYCWYNNDISNRGTYGALYNWNAVMDKRNLAPSGWHIPSDAEWTILSTFLGGDSIAGGKMKESGFSHWRSPNTGATNESGFTALPHGYCYGPFFNLGQGSGFWSTTGYSDTHAWGRAPFYNSSDINRSWFYKFYGFGVRCISD